MPIPNYNTVESKEDLTSGKFKLSTVVQEMLKDYPTDDNKNNVATPRGSGR